MGKWVLILLVGGIAIVFVFLGVFPETRGINMGNADVASIGDERISIKELQDTVSREMEAYKALGANLPDALLMNVRQQALSGLIQQKLFLIEARRMGISVSDKEVMAEIQTLPYFQDKTKKTFDIDTYRKLLQANNTSPSQFEAMVRDTIISRRLLGFLEARIRISDAELQREYELSGETRSLGFVRFTKEAAFKKMTVSSDEVKKFLADETKVNLVQTYYAQNNQKYNKPAEVCARHILKRYPKELKEGEKEPPVPSDFAAIKPTAKNFAALAKKQSDDPGSKSQGGDLGCFATGVMDKAFESMAFKTSVGQVSAPFASRFGWHYLYVYKKNNAINTPMEKAKSEIAEELLKKERMAEVRKINKEMAESVVKSWPPKNEELQLTGSFNRLEGFIPKIGRADEILNAAFDDAAKIQKGPQVFEAQGAFIVASVKEKQSPDLTKFAKEKETLLKTLRTRKMQAFMPAWMEDVRGRVKIKLNEDLLKQM